jgi:hypothetical protein
LDDVGFKSDGLPVDVFLLHSSLKCERVEAELELLDRIVVYELFNTLLLDDLLCLILWLLVLLLLWLLLLLAVLVIITLK